MNHFAKNPTTNLWGVKMMAALQVVAVFEMVECKMTAVSLFRDGDCRCGLINSKPQCRMPFGRYAM